MVLIFVGLQGITVDDVSRKRYIGLVLLGIMAAMAYTADRTGMWLKENRHFNPWLLGFLLVCVLSAGFLSSQHSDQDVASLNEEQMKEWKGWMQRERNSSAY